jgi:hypothetical protein
MNKDEIRRLCDYYNIPNYTINDDMSIDVSGDIWLCHKHLKELPLKFRYVSNDFSCYSNILTTLEGSPVSIGGSFRCNNNRISNFKGAPKSISGLASYQHNYIRDIYNITKTTEYIYIEQNPVFILIHRFIRRKDKNEWIDFFNDCDIIRDDNIIWDRLVFFYDYLDIIIDQVWESKIGLQYEIIK